jgi:hypothetical protein
MMHPHIVNGETLWLVQPQHIGAKWSEETLVFRSSVWNDAGELVSAGFKKFFNWSEQPEVSPVPQSLKNATIVEKIDGSLLIVSKYKGNYILRTRGTVDASKLDNGHEIELFKETILPHLDAIPEDPTMGASWLFEWVSPENRIILNYGDQPNWYLVGFVSHQSYTLMSQSDLDTIADQFGFKRPVSYDFPSVEALMADVEQWKGKEGVCVYSKDGQRIHKVKGLWYLALHRMKEALASFDKVVDVWYEQGQPDYVKFQDFIVGQFDWELWTQVRGDASRICDGAKEVQQIVDGMQKYVNDTLLPLGDPKDKKVRGQQARQVVASYGITNRANFVFKLLDSKPLESEDRKKLLYQVLKK